MSSVLKSLLASMTQKSRFAIRSDNCCTCKRYLSSKPKLSSDEKVKEDKISSEKISVDDINDKDCDGDLFGALKKQVEANGTGSEVIEKNFSRIQRISDIPKHQLPVEEIIGKKKKVWWDSEMSRPSIRERIWQGDPIDKLKEPKGLAKLKPQRLRKVKGAHIKSLDQQFVDAYEEIGANKVAFNFVCEEFRKKSLRGWGFMEFQYVAMEYMKAFNVHRDADAYNQLLNMYPRGPLRQTTIFAEAFQLGLMEQNCALNVLHQMHRNEVLPDMDTLDILFDVFGPTASPVSLLRHMWYWIPRIKNIDPWPFPDPLPSNPIDTSKIVLERISDYDQQYSIMCGSYETADVDDAYLVSSMNEEQKEELAALPKGSSLVVSGPFLVYLKKRMSHSYFVLRGEPPNQPVQPRTDEIEFNPAEYEEGYVYATAVTGQPDHTMARLWVSELAKQNPNIEHMFVTYKLTGNELAEFCAESIQKPPLNSDE